MRPAAVLVAAAWLVAAGCGQQDGEPTEADTDARAWRTWVLESPADIRVPAPAAGERGPRREARDTAGAGAVAPWLERAMDFIAARTKDPPAASRAYALVSVAMYDAAVTARHWQAVYAGEGGAGSVTYPDEHAAVAGAASRVLAYVFPEQPETRLKQAAEQAAGSRVAAAAAGPGDVEAGLALGREVAARVIEWGRRDGSDREWPGSVPAGERYWKPPPGSAARPVSPLAGRWRTWVMESGSRFRAPPPPAFGTAEFQREAREVVRVERELTEEQKRIAKFWEGGEGTELPPGVWIRVALEYLRDRPLSVPRAARVLALLNIAMSDAGVAAWDTKYEYWTPRPENAIRDLGIARGWKPYLPTPFFPAYVSGHAVYSGAAAEVLAHLFPQDAGLFHVKAREATDSRLYGGIHFRSDNEVGLEMGREVGRLVVRRARADGAGRG